MSELKEYIDRKLRLAKLDSALLFFSSSLSIAFGVGYAYLGTEWLQYYLPMLLLGWFMPIYIGYVRGSIIQDSIEERVRGWIYFAMGLGFYILNPLIVFCLVEVLGEGFHVVIFSAVPSSVFGYFLGGVHLRIARDIFKIQILRDEVKQAFAETKYSAITLAVFLMFLSAIDLSEFFKKTDLLLNIIGLVMLLSPLSKVDSDILGCRKLYKLSTLRGISPLKMVLTGLYYRSSHK